MRWKNVMVAVAMLGGVALLPQQAGAADAPSLSCTFTVHLGFHPGISMQLEPIRIDTAVPGAANCSGTWAGRAVAGRGLARFTGDALGDCPASTIDSTVSLDLPLVGGGRALIEVPLRSGRAGEAIHGTGADPAHPASLVATGTPDAGQQCVTVPITGLTAEGRLLVR